jgi:hypothetical protein
MQPHIKEVISQWPKESRDLRRARTGGSRSVTARDGE